MTIENPGVPPTGNEPVSIELITNISHNETLKDVAKAQKKDLGEIYNMVFEVGYKRLMRQDAIDY